MSQHRRSLWLLFFTLFQTLIGFGIIMPVMPLFARRLGAGSVEMGLLVTVWAGAQFLTSAWWGALSDRIGRRPVLLLGLAGYIVAFAAMGLAPTMPVLLVARLAGGLLSAAAIPAAQAYAADITPPERRGRVMAAMGAAMNLGFICGPALGALIAPFGERVTFFFAAGLAAVNLIATYWLLPEPAERKTAGARRPGSGLAMVGQALRGPNAILYILAFAATFGGSQMFSMLGFYLMDRFGYGAAEAGIAFTVEGLAAAILQIVVVAPALRWLGEIGTVRTSLVAGALGFGCLVLAPGLAGVLVGLVLIAAAIDCLRPTVAGMLSKRTTLQQGITMGIQTSFDALGRTVGPLWAGLLYRLEPRVPYTALVVIYALVFLWAGTALAAQAHGERTA